MRTLAPAPPSIALGTSGSFRGALPRIDWAAPLATRLRSAKSWLYLAIATDEAWLSLAILKTGYAANVLGYAFDRKERRMLFEKTVVAPAPLARVTSAAHASGVVASFRDLVIDRSGPDLTVRGKYGPLECDFTLDESVAPPGIVAVADLGGGLANATEKRALCPARGRFSIDGRVFSADDGVAGWDYTNGLLPRHTTWRWAYGLGKDLGFNLVQGFVGAAECALFADGEVHPLAEATFTFDRDRPSEPWRIEGEGIDLRFEVGAVHAQNTNLVVVRSRFLQPVGTFFGTLAGRTIDGTPGVVEDQDVLW